MDNTETRELEEKEIDEQLRSDPLTLTIKVMCMGKPMTLEQKKEMLESAKAYKALDPNAANYEMLKMAYKVNMMLLASGQNVLRYPDQD